MYNSRSIFYDLSKIDLNSITISDNFIKKESTNSFFCRAKYNESSLWGIVSPQLKIIDAEQLSDNEILVTFLLPDDDPSFVNIMTELENLTINHIYVNSLQIYGKNKTLPIIYANHTSIVSSDLKSLKLKIVLNKNTSFWSSKETQLDKITINKILNFNGRSVVLLVRMNGIIINKKGNFTTDFRVEQILFKESESESESEPDNDIEIEYSEIPDRIVQNEFRKRLFLKF
jgi:hypothetical protein